MAAPIFASMVAIEGGDGEFEMLFFSILDFVVADPM